MYAKRFTQKKFSWGGVALVAAFPAHGGVSIAGSVLGGAQFAHSEELAKVHAQMLLEGTHKRSKKNIQLLLDSSGASLSFSTGEERLVFVGRVREKHLGTLLELIAEVLVEPAFPKPELEILKKREEASLALEAQDTRAQAGIGLSRLLFGKGHPNYTETTAQSLKNLKGVTQKSLAALHRNTLSRETLILSMAGDIKPQKVFSFVEKSFNTLPSKHVKPPAFKKVTPKKARVSSQHIPHKASIDLMFGVATGITKGHKDFPALMLGLQVLGNAGGFTGRLMKTVREEEGLTYGVYSYMSGFAKKIDGYLSVWGTFAPELFEKGRAGIMREIQRIVRDGATEVEVKKHREMYEARSRVALANSGALARAGHDTVAEGFPLSRIDTFPKQVLKLTRKKVNAALKKYLKPELLSESKAGPVKR